MTNWLLKWMKSHVEIDRPNWDEYFMTMAILAATRSQDAQWQAGAVLVKDRKVLGTGYNSFPRGMPDKILPNTRPFKYDWVIHSEANALYNAGETSVDGATCYTNGYPCLECMKACYQKGVKNFVVTKGKATMLDSYTDQQRAVYDYLIQFGQIKIREIQITKGTLKRTLAILEKSN